MKELIKKNFALVLAFVLPILLILIVALTTYLPSAFISTKYNFIYTSCTDGYNYHPYNCDDYLKGRYSVPEDKIVVNKLTEDAKAKYSDRIFLHDTQKNESREISLKEAETLTLSSLLTSPDGITVSSYYDRNGGDFFIFGGGYSSYGYYLTKGKSKSKINLINNSDQYYYQNNFQFLGWVLPGRN